MSHNCYVPEGKYQKKSILAICYAISTKSGSEPGAGMAVVRAHLNLGAKVTLVTTPNCAKDLMNLGDMYNDSLDVMPMNYGKLFGKIIGGMPLQVKYISWNLYVRSRGKEINFSQYDLVHHITYAGDWNPTVIHLLPRQIKTLWGPVGGAQKIPKNLSKQLLLKSRISNFFHSKLGDLARSLLCRRLKATQTIILAANSATESFFNKITNVISFQNVSFPRVESSQSWSKSSGSNFYFGAGRLLYWKNWETPIRAMSHLNNDRLLIAGDGPHVSALVKLIKLLKLEERVILLGRIERSEVLRLIRTSKGVVFPSLRDSASWALGEALHLGAPVVAFDLPGNRCLSDKCNVELVSTNGNFELKFTIAMSRLSLQKEIEIGSQCHCIMLKKFEEEVYPIIFNSE